MFGRVTFYNSLNHLTTTTTTIASKLFEIYFEAWDQTYGDLYWSEIEIDYNGGMYTTKQGFYPDDFTDSSTYTGHTGYPAFFWSAGGFILYSGDYLQTYITSSRFGGFDNSMWELYDNNNVSQSTGSGPYALINYSGIGDGWYIVCRYWTTP